jgi:tRNA-uridine 2-sulfurtransferase
VSESIAGQGVPAVVALSGGVDSAVAAALLVEQGYDVTGVMLKLWAECGAGNCHINRCCTPASVARAREVAGQLDIPFRLIDVQDEFREAVVDYFIAEYAAGRTPCPCVPCNHTIRFGLLLDLALRSGAEFLATGHYARIYRDGERYVLLRGVDRTKDQSYFLHILGQHQLAHVRFPLGEMTKLEVRKAARHRNLPVAEEPESQDLCFLGDGDYRRFLAERVPEFFTPGPIRNARGYLLGEHQGLPSYTIGQRGGLNLTSAEPLYVLEIVAEENALIVGTSGELGRGTCLVDALCYVAGDTPDAPFRANVQIRSQAEATSATVTPLSEARIRVDFDFPQRAVTPGQFLVIYDGQEVLGGGVMLPRH